MNKQKGFTIIELIVVIAIIAVLAVIVLSNVTSYIAKGRDAAAKGNLGTLLTNGAMFYDEKTTFTNFPPAGAAGAITTIAAGTACGGDPSFNAPCSALTGAAGTGYAVNYTCGAASSAGAILCSAAKVEYWCVSITLKDGKTYCVDSTGEKKTNSTCIALGGTATLPPGTCN